MTNQPQTQTKPNNELYLLALVAAVLGIYRWGSVTAGVLSGLVVAGVIFLYQNGAFVELSQKTRPYLIQLWHRIRYGIQREESRQLQRYDVLLGRDVDTGEWVFANLKSLKSSAVWGVNGTGKTSFLHALVHFILNSYLESGGVVYGPSDIRLAISDLKDGVDFSIYQRLPHLLCDIATTVPETNDLIAVINDEMRERSRLFKAVSGGEKLALCNDLDRYHDLRQKRGFDSLPQLPRVLVIFEEISTFTRNAKTLNQLILIAEKGRAYGIHLICCTQYPKVDSIPGNLREQLNSRIVGSMSKRAYQVAEVYKEDWGGRELAVGQWFMGVGNNGSSYQVIQGVLYPDSELARVANAVSAGNKSPGWPKLRHGVEVTAVPNRWTGSDDEKRHMLLDWFERFDECPAVDEFTAEFGASRRTYFNWVPQLWQEWKGD